MNAKYASIMIYMLAYMLSLSVLNSCTSNEVLKIKINKETGMYSIPAKVNGLNLNFIFDTGASDVCISLTEAAFMAKNGYLSEEDIEGTSFAKLADGNVSKNTKIKLKTIEIGDIKIHDITAMVAHNVGAPLLLGQSVIRKLGKIEFDGDYLYIHHSSSKKSNEELDNKILAKHQSQLDSLLKLAHKEFKDKDYVIAAKHIKDARTAAYNYGLSNRNWELDYIDGTIKHKNAATFYDGWYNSMPLYHSAFHGNERKEDGLVITMDDLIESYVSGLSQHFSPTGTQNDNDMSYEDEFIDVISLWLNDDNHKYKAYCRCAIFYQKNFEVAKNYCQRAIDMDSTKSLAFQTMGYLYYYTISDSENAKKYYIMALSKKDCDRSYVYRLLA